jgi:hypothetical protein
LHPAAGTSRLACLTAKFFSSGPELEQKMELDIRPEQDLAGYPVGSYMILINLVFSPTFHFFNHFVEQSLKEG